MENTRIKNPPINKPPKLNIRINILMQYSRYTRFPLVIVFVARLYLLDFVVRGLRGELFI